MEAPLLYDLPFQIWTAAAYALAHPVLEAQCSFPLCQAWISEFRPWPVLTLKDPSANLANKGSSFVFAFKGDDCEYARTTPSNPARLDPRTSIRF
uniref:Secreted protein n=1 Tax=Steinernema glaseri TaxID=37863 RepID=A0A1I7ZQ58_9BILA